MFCPKCGSELKEGALFCSHCGNQVLNNSHFLADDQQRDALPKKQQHNVASFGIALTLILLFVILIGSSVIFYCFVGLPPSEKRVRKALSQDIKSFRMEWIFSYYSSILGAAERRIRLDIEGEKGHGFMSTYAYGVNEEKELYYYDRVLYTNENGKWVPLQNDSNEENPFELTDLVDTCEINSIEKKDNDIVVKGTVDFPLDLDEHLSGARKMDYTMKLDRHYHFKSIELEADHVSSEISGMIITIYDFDKTSVAFPYDLETEIGLK